MTHSSNPITIKDIPAADAADKTFTRRSMHSGSPVFEVGYSAFMDDVFARGIQSVQIVETEEARCIVLAGCKRISLIKRTGLLQLEMLVAIAPCGTEEVWERIGFDDICFWSSPSAIANYVEAAWIKRLAFFIPGHEECYPDKAAFVERFGYDEAQGWGDQRDSIRSSFIGLAAKRRIGIASVRRGATRTFISAIWNLLVDREILRLTIGYFGHHASFADYNFTVKRRRDLIAREMETPNLVPLIGKYIKRNAKLKAGRAKLPQNILLLAKAKYVGAELSPVGWRYFASGNKRSVEKYLEHMWYRGDGEEMLSSEDAINILAETGMKYPASFVDWFLEVRKRIEKLSKDNRANLIRFIRVAGNESLVNKRRGRVKKFIRSELTLAWDWLLDGDNFDCGPAFVTESSILQAVPKNATWRSIMRAQQAWHDGAAERARIRREADALAYEKYIEVRSAISWKSEIDSIEIDGITALPLTTGKDLLLEADEMDHCVDDYIDYCKRGDSRIFRLKGVDGDATMEIVPSVGKRWKVRQVFGVHNRDAPLHMHVVAKVVAERYTAAVRNPK